MEKQYILHIVSVCVCILALIIRHAKCIFSSPCYIVICGLVLQNFFTLSHKQHNFQKSLLNVKCLFLFSLQLTSEISRILRRIQQVIFMNVHRSSFKVPVILFRFLIFLTGFKK